MYPGSVVNNPRIKLGNSVLKSANISVATGYIRVTPGVSAYYSSRSQSLILVMVLTHSQCLSECLIFLY